MPADAHCVNCGAPLVRDEEGHLCPACLLKVGLEEEVLGTTRLTPPPTTTPDRPDRIGPYRILETLGEGGMGIVYLAQQEEPIHRRVALKVIKVGMDTRQVVARFEAERRALALMDHPNIAAVFDAGATEEGRPYFVMEHVAGLPVTEYCDRHRLSTRARLELFTEVCAAVQHAHQKGVIHRDIKPTNVLVTEQDDRPVPKVIDFGVAKATNQRLTERTLFTDHGLLIGTPEYMSPEQADSSGGEVDTRTDLYSLGVVLYELLVGAVPFEPEALRAAGYGEILRILREEEPTRPSTKLSGLGDSASEVAKRRQTTVPTLVRELSGDLDWVVLKALEKERSRRYASASELAADLTRHLHDEPVAARPPSAAYRTRKFVRRHRAAFWASAAVVTMLAVSTAVSTALFVRAEGEAYRNRIETDAFAAWIQDLQEFGATGNELPRYLPLARQSVALQLERADEEPGVVAARLMNHLFLAQFTHLSLSFAPGHQPVPPAVREFEDDVLRNLGEVAGRLARQRDQRAYIYSPVASDGFSNEWIEDIARASEPWKELLRELTRWEAEEPPRSGAQERLIELLAGLGELNQEAGRLQEAETELDEARKLLESADEDDGCCSSLGYVERRLARVWKEQGRYREAYDLLLVAQGKFPAQGGGCVSLLCRSDSTRRREYRGLREDLLALYEVWEPPVDQRGTTEAGPDPISASLQSLDFSEVPVGTRVTRTVELVNPNAFSVHIVDAWTSNGFSISESFVLPIEMPAAGGTVVSVDFSPARVRSYDAWLYIDVDTAAEDVLRLRLGGRGVERR